jgi:hypothetical protein
MENQDVRKWEAVVDAADAVDSLMTTDLPTNAQPGDTYTGAAAEGGVGGGIRSWRRVIVIAGSVGGRWAYWAPWATIDKCAGQGVNPEFKVIADKIFNSDAHHFVGMLAVPYVNKALAVGGTWVLTSPIAEPPRTIYVHERDGDGSATRTRYEKSNEVYDVETGKSKRLP